MNTIKTNKVAVVIGCLTSVLVSCDSNIQSKPQSNMKSMTNHNINSSNALKYESNQAKYLKLRTEWEKERQQFSKYSDTRAYWKGPVGKEIISMGKAAIPFLIKELQDGDFFFNIPLEIITGISINGSSEQDKVKGWLDWWQKNKGNPKWNLYI